MHNSQKLVTFQLLQPLYVKPHLLSNLRVPSGLNPTPWNFPAGAHVL